jgi:hypothetical protein
VRPALSDRVTRLGGLGGEQGQPCRKRAGLCSESPPAHCRASDQTFPSRTIDLMGNHGQWRCLFDYRWQDLIGPQAEQAAHRHPRRNPDLRATTLENANAALSR